VNGTCESCHNVSLNRDLHSLDLAVYNATSAAGENGSCYECHTQEGVAGLPGYVNASTIQFSGPIHNNTGGEGNCTRCHKAPTVFHFKATPLEDVYISGVKYNCTNCHILDLENFSTQDFNASEAHVVDASTDLNTCYNCHTNETDATYLPALHNITNAKPTNCRMCHDVGSGVVVDSYINVSVFAAGMHNDTIKDGVSNDSECMLCHNDTAGMNITYSKSLDVNVHSCTACHRDNVESITLPLVREHIPAGAENISTGATCDACHNNSVAVAAGVTVDTAFENVSHYGTNETLPDTSVCQACHMDPTTAYYAQNRQVYNHTNATWSIGKNCSYCHDENKLADDTRTLLSFHNETYTKLPSATYNCLTCHRNQTPYQFVADDRIIYTHYPGAPESVELVTNGDFENGLTDWNEVEGVPGSISINTTERYSGQNSTQINHSAGTPTSYIYQTLTLAQNTEYRLSGYIRTYNIEGTGAHLVVNGSGLDVSTSRLTGTNAWTYVSVSFDSGTTTNVDVSAVLNASNGTALFDEISLKAYKKGNTSRVGADCMTCHNATKDGVYTNAGLHSANLTVYKGAEGVANGTCYVCHTDYGQFWNKSNRRFNDPLHNTSTGTENCSICHNATGEDRFHFSEYPQGSVAKPGWSGWDNGTNANCTSCHIDYNGTDPFYAPSPMPKHNITGVSIDECYDCHTNTSTYSAWPAALHNITVTPPSDDCIACHAVGVNITVGHIDVAAFNSTVNKTLHGDINKDGVRSNNSDCMLCHYNLAGMGIGWEVNSSTTRNCTGCHFYGEVSQAPRIYGHTPEEYISSRYIDYCSEDKKNTRWFKPGKTAVCELCHNNSVAPSNDTDLTSAMSNVSHYGTNTTLKPGGFNTTKCTTCHKSAEMTPSQRAAYGLDPDSIVVMGTDEQDCWICHLGINFCLTKGTPPNPPEEDFHEASLDNFMWNCDYCH
jgi:nitrate/TMAO reductase-like tetraheme cytochrome c subunit